MKLLSNFHIRFLIFSALIAALIGVLSYFLPTAIHESVWTIFAFVCILSYGVSGLSLWLYKAAPDSFLQIKMLGMVLRVLGSLTFIGVLVYLKTGNILLFITNFFVLFLFYLLFDIYTFMITLRPISK